MHSSLPKSLKPLLAGALSLLSGCQAPAPVATAQQPAEQERQRFLYGFNVVLSQNSQYANHEDWVGGLTLRVRIDRNNTVVGCSTAPNVEYPLSRFPDNARLAPMLEQVCWNALLPVAPAQMFMAGDDWLEVTLELAFSDPAQMPLPARQAREFRRLSYWQSDYVWQQAFAHEAVDGIGTASFEGVTDDQGQVRSCQVELDMALIRASQFKPDADLQLRLLQRCRQLDLRQLPGKREYRQGLERFSVKVDYTPWKGGPNPQQQ